MLNSEVFLVLALCTVAAAGEIPPAYDQVKSAKVFIETARPIKLNTINHRPETQLSKEIRTKQATSIKPLMRDSAIRVTLNDHSAGYTRVDNIFSVLDRVAFAISKPAAIVNVLRFVALAVSSMIMSTFIFPSGHLLDAPHKRRYRDRYSPFSHVTKFDIEGMIESMARNYDETLNRAGFHDRSVCRERSLCVFGDMMACDFPSFVVTVGRFAHNHLPPIDTHKNKYTKALALGLNQTDCDRVYRTNVYECPSFRDYVRSYFHGGVRRRRDSNYWRRQ